ncbi:unnamed protein product [Chironomus riparius]|uniref:Alkaline phosphatase n=1 Tax=Chironomus riparius TaxID=315576 RepID=A0A9P0JGJ8_9DIPT|nr:unnamed protein product [Chironomus riparius]
MIQQINNKHCCSRLSINAYFLIVVNLILIIVGCVLVFGHSLNLNREIFDPNHDEWSYNDPKWESLIPNWWDQKNFKPPVGPAEESTQEFWKSKAQKTLQDKLNSRINTNKAKNVVIMIGDGMGFSSIMAARSYLKDVSAELSFEKFHHSGMSKVYCVNYQVPDSACTATAILRGIKNNYSVIGLTSKVNLYNCSASHDEEARIPSIFKYAQDADKSTGIVTTTRVTHSTPAAVYAYAASRNWESDDNLVPDGCDDIGKQLIHGPVGSKLDVVLGGGLGNLMPEELGGKRRDGRNLVDEYKKQHKNSSVVYNKDQLKSVDPKTTDKLLGLFANSHLDFKLFANDETQPTLTEMTAKALDILKKNQENGFMLMVEGGRIDRAHHENQAHLALEEVVEFHKAVEYVKQNTNEEDTLIIVTADHSHPFTIGGYLPRGRNILGPGDYSIEDKKWIFSASYGQGQGYYNHFDKEAGERKSPRGMKYMEPTFKQPSAVPMDEGTHSGEDVGVFASGPYSHLFTGVYEQNFIAHGMMYASCLGPDDVLKNPKCENDAENEIK